MLGKLRRRQLKVLAIHKSSAILHQLSVQVSTTKKANILNSAILYVRIYVAIGNKAYKVSLYYSKLYSSGLDELSNVQDKRLAHIFMFLLNRHEEIQLMPGTRLNIGSKTLMGMSGYGRQQEHNMEAPLGCRTPDGTHTNVDPNRNVIGSP